MAMKTKFAKSADGTEIAYVSSGSGPPLIFAHGASGDKSANPELQELLRQDFTVTAYDRRGRGESGDHPDYEFLKEADDLRAVISSMDELPVVLGISMGARIALEMLRDPPDLKSLVLFEAPATDEPEQEFIAKLADVRDELTSNGNEAATILHSRQFHRRSEAEISELRNDASKWALRVDSFPITLREMEAVHRDCMFQEANYRPPTFPTHLLTGDATLPFLKRSGEMIGRLTSVDKSVITGGNHSYPSTQPRIIAELVTETLHQPSPKK